MDQRVRFYDIPSDKAKKMRVVHLAWVVNFDSKGPVRTWAWQHPYSSLYDGYTAYISSIVCYMGIYMTGDEYVDMMLNPSNEEIVQRYINDGVHLRRTRKKTLVTTIVPIDYRGGKPGTKQQIDFDGKWYPIYDVMGVSDSTLASPWIRSPFKWTRSLIQDVLSGIGVEHML